LIKAKNRKQNKQQKKTTRFVFRINIFYFFNLHLWLFEDYFSTLIFIDVRFNQIKY